MFSCEFCKTSKNTFCYRAPPAAASNDDKTHYHINIERYRNKNYKLGKANTHHQQHIMK